MGLAEIIRGLFRKKEAAPAEPKPPREPQAGARPKKTCRGCGKEFSYDPSLEYVPNYCRECKKKFTQEKEAKQRAGAPRKIRRKCRACGKTFTFPNTLEHFPTYCGDCRKRHQAEMKAKYSRKGQGKK